MDVNLGNSPEAFVRAAYCQITGQEPPPKTLELWSGRLKQDARVRRVDVVRSIAAEKKREIKLSYSDPWASEPELSGAPARTSKRDIGAVCMFFFNCPGGANCGMDWANTARSRNVQQPHALLGIRERNAGYYTPTEPGFWRRELLDAQYAGLVSDAEHVRTRYRRRQARAARARRLASIDHPIQIALFDDTWTWGQPYFGEFWKQKPDLMDAEKAANTLYETKWKPFFHRWTRAIGIASRVAPSSISTTPEHSSPASARPRSSRR